MTDSAFLQRPAPQADPACYFQVLYSVLRRIYEVLILQKNGPLWGVPLQPTILMPNRTMFCAVLRASVLNFFLSFLFLGGVGIWLYRMYMCSGLTPGGAPRTCGARVKRLACEANPHPDLGICRWGPDICDMYFQKHNGPCKVGYSWGNLSGSAKMVIYHVLEFPRPFSWDPRKSSGE